MGAGRPADRSTDGFCPLVASASKHSTPKGGLSAGRELNGPAAGRGYFASPSSDNALRISAYVERMPARGLPGRPQVPSEGFGRGGDADLTSRRRAEGGGADNAYGEIAAQEDFLISHHVGQSAAWRRASMSARSRKYSTSLSSALRADVKSFDIPSAISSEVSGELRISISKTPR